MSKFIGYVVILSGLILLFNFFDLSTGTTGLIHFLNNPESYTSFGLYAALTGMLVLFTAAVGISLFVSGSFKIDFVAIAPMVALLLGYLGEILSIFSTIANGSRAIALLVFSPLMILWVMTTVEWWRGVNY